MSERKSVEVSVRQIENGWVKETCTCDDGDYKRSESFSKTKPELNLNSDRPQSRPGGSSLRDTVKMMNKGSC